jgi:DNA helicase-2/ATP-dependent DNA helicase PcrA
MTDDPRIYSPRVREAPATATAAELASGLNEAQRRAATHGDGPLLVVAGAGTGKTRTLVYRVAHLIARGVRPERILLLTFTRRAAQEMVTRAERLVGERSRHVQGGTFHATAHRLLRRFGPRAGLAADFTIMDQGDAEDLMQLSRGALGYAEKKHKRFPKKETLHHVYSRHVNTELPVGEILRDQYRQFVDFEGDFARIYADYTRRKADRNLVDYDDLLLFWATLLEASPALGAEVAALYEHVLVDEYQDTNALQARVLRGMGSGHRNVTAVGDDAQSIYSFRGASVRNIFAFPAIFAGTTVVALEENYRSTQPILDATNAVIAGAAHRYDKTLWTRREGGEAPWLVTTHDERAQTGFVADRVLELHEQGVALREIAVLFRAGYMSADLEFELTARGVPFEKWGGLKFLEAAHVKDVLAFLRVLENPRDEVSWYRLLQLLPGVGDATARGAIALLAEHAWDPDAFARFRPPPRAREGHTRLAAVLRDLRADRDGRAPGAEIARFRTLYDAVLRDLYDRAEPRLADLDQLQTIASGYPSRAAFLTALALEPPSATQDLAGPADGDRDALVLSTVHSAKGKEWDAVFVIWAVDGFFPSSRSLGDEDELDEERRLMYVAMTRARDHLAVVHPLNVYGSRRGADYSLDQLSRFIDGDVRARMQRVVLAADLPAAAPPSPAGPSGVDLRAVLRGRFGG